MSNLERTSQKVTFRLPQLDGLRGLAVLMVFFFHAFSRWPELLPYGDSYAEILIFKYGWIGVNLFFLISGFVILMSLERCRSLAEFLRKRWIRLFPAMMIASVLIYLTAPLFSERPAGAPPLSDLMPGLTFLEPLWWSGMMGYRVHPLEGAFWTLFVEWKFYIISAVAYFATGQRPVVLIFFLLFCGLSAESLERWPSTQDFLVANRFNVLAGHLSLKYFIWFSAGASFYLGWKQHSSAWLNIGLATAVVASVLSAVVACIPLAEADPGSLVAALLVSLLFAASLQLEQAKRILSSNLLVYFGFISYPLYLMHENITISAVIQLGKEEPSIPGFALPLVPFVFLSVASSIIAYVIEPFMRAWLNQLFVLYKSLTAVKAL